MTSILGIVYLNFLWVWLLVGVAVGACGAAEPAALLIVLRPISTCITQILSTNTWGNCGFPNCSKFQTVFATHFIQLFVNRAVCLPALPSSLACKRYLIGSCSHPTLLQIWCRFTHLGLHAPQVKTGSHVFCIIFPELLTQLTCIMRILAEIPAYTLQDDLPHVKGLDNEVIINNTCLQMKECKL